jgi:hypothetical protein
VRRLYKGLILAAGLVLIACLAVGVKSMLELQAVRRELLAVTTANEFLKKTLGDMAIAITAKEKEIDRLEHTGCGGQEKAPPAAHMAPHRSKVSD